MANAFMPLCPFQYPRDWTCRKMSEEIICAQLFTFGVILWLRGGSTTSSHMLKELSPSCALTNAYFSIYLVNTNAVILEFKFLTLQPD